MVANKWPGFSCFVLGFETLFKYQYQLASFFFSSPLCFITLIPYNGYC